MIGGVDRLDGWMPPEREIPRFETLISQMCIIQDDGVIRDDLVERAESLALRWHVLDNAAWDRIERAQHRIAFESARKFIPAEDVDGSAATDAVIAWIDGGMERTGIGHLKEWWHRVHFSNGLDPTSAASYVAGAALMATKEPEYSRWTSRFHVAYDVSLAIEAARTPVYREMNKRKRDTAQKAEFLLAADRARRAEADRVNDAILDAIEREIAATESEAA